MTLKALLNTHGKMDWRDQDPNFSPQSLVIDSREIETGSVFVALKGTQVDGHDFLKKAAELGAAALVVESLSNVPKNFKGAVLQVLDTRLVLPLFAQRFFENPGDSLISLAVTGTNGKTSVTYIVEHLLNGQKKNCGVIGTIDHHLGEKRWQTNLTSPDPVTLNKRLHEFLDQGAQSFIIEASSHALKQNRVAQSFNGVIFTNLSRDHLDYHPDMEDYFSSKAKLFSRELLKEGSDNFALINSDDEYGKKLVELTEGRVIYRYGQTEADLLISNIDDKLGGTSFDLNLPPNQSVKIKSPLIGVHNVYNVVAALGVIHALGLNMQKAVKDLESFPGIPGRLQGVQSQSGVFGFVDYAHTPDALEKVLISLKKLKKETSRLICVFGCGGDRDRGKRALMGEVSKKHSDLSVVTSDNPRTEDPEKIVAEIMTAFKLDSPPAEGGLPHVVTEVGREKAIKLACFQAKPGDVVLIAGKGHENYQITGTEKKDFDDFKLLQKYLR